MCLGGRTWSGLRRCDHGTPYVRRTCAAESLVLPYLTVTIPQETVDPATDAASQLAAELSQRFLDRNYSDEYLARRCRATPDAVACWRSGARVPNDYEWWNLCRVSRDFSQLDELRREARGDQERSPTGVSTSLAGSPVVEVSEAQADQEVLRRDISPRVVQRGEGLTSPCEQDAAPTHGGPVVGLVESGDEQAIRVPRGCVVFRCRISRGRVVEIPLPVDLTRRDADRLCAFLQTQADPDADLGAGPL